MSVLFLLSALAPWPVTIPAVQQAGADKVLDRVHLKNGGVIDGKILLRNAKELVINLPNGDITISATQVVKVERVVVRSGPDGAKDGLPLGPKNQDKGKGPKIIQKKTPTQKAPVVPLPGPIREQVDRHLLQIQTAPRSERIEAVKELSEMGGEVSPYLASLLPTMAPDIRNFVAVALRRMRDPSSIPVLIPLLSNPDSSVRTHAVVLLTAAGGPKHVRYLIPLLKDDSPAVRSTVITALERLANKKTLALIAPLCADDDSGVRWRALEAIKKLSKKFAPSQEVLDVFSRLVKKAKGPALADVIKGVGHLRKQEAWSLVNPFLVHRSDPIRRATAAAMLELRAPDSGYSVLSRLRLEKDVETRILLAKTVARFKMREAIYDLIEWLRENNEPIKEAAAEALSKITGRQFGTDVIAWSAWFKKTQLSGGRK